jgi:hypothetical protein
MAFRCGYSGWRGLNVGDLGDWIPDQVLYILP